MCTGHAETEILLCVFRNRTAAACDVIRWGVGLMRSSVDLCCFIHPPASTFCGFQEESVNVKAHINIQIYTHDSSVFGSKPTEHWAISRFKGEIKTNYMLQPTRATWRQREVMLHYLCVKHLRRGGAVVWTWNAFSLELFQVQREAVIPETGKVLQTIWQQMTPLAAAAECCFCCQENIHNKQRACVKSTHTPRCYRADVAGMHPCKWSAVVISKDKGGLITWLWPGADGWLRDHLSQPDGAATGSRKQKLWFKSYYWPLCVLLLICLM